MSPGPARAPVRPNLARIGPVVSSTIQPSLGIGALQDRQPIGNAATRRPADAAAPSRAVGLLKAGAAAE
jgi:hypothetical protein